jgi:hypothetical protein
MTVELSKVDGVLKFEAGANRRTGEMMFVK